MSEGMAQTVCILRDEAARARRTSIIGDRWRPFKHIQRARIVLLSAGRLSVLEAARRSGAGSSTLPRKASRACCMTRPARQGTAVGAHRRRGIGPDLLRATGRGHALGRSRRSRTGRHLAAVRATHLGGPPPTTAPRAHLQALERCRLRRKGQGHRRPLHGSAASRGRALHRREVPDLGAGAHMTRPAARLRAPHRPDPRLHPPRHHHTVFRARRPGRNRARPLHAAPSQR